MGQTQKFCKYFFVVVIFAIAFGCVCVCVCVCFHFLSVFLFAISLVTMNLFNLFAVVMHMSYLPSHFKAEYGNLDPKTNLRPEQV